MKKQRGFALSLNPTSYDICSTGSCRFFNTFTMPLQGLQNLRYCYLQFLCFHSSCDLSFSVIFRDDAHRVKTIKTHNKARKDHALIVTRCSSWERWPLVSRWVSSTSIFNSKQGQEMCIGLGMLRHILFSRCWTNQRRNPAAGRICFGPGLTNHRPCKAQTNFLADNKANSVTTSSTAKGRYTMNAI